MDRTTGALKTSRYGETVKRTQGLNWAGLITITRPKEWTIQPKAAGESEEGTDTSVIRAPAVFASAVDFLQAFSLSSSPWSTVNNCTHPSELEAPIQVKPLKFHNEEEEACWLTWLERRTAAGESDYPDLYALQERAAIRAESLLALAGGAV